MVVTVVQTAETAVQVVLLEQQDKEQLLMSLAIVHLPSMLVAVVPEHLVALVVLAVLVAVETARLAIVQRVVQLRQILAVVEAVVEDRQPQQIHGIFVVVRVRRTARINLLTNMG